jgi:hypothetical protein
LSWTRPQDSVENPNNLPKATYPRSEQNTHTIASALGDAMSGLMSLVDIDQISSPQPSSPPSSWPLNPGAPTMLPRNITPQPSVPFIESIADLSVDIPVPDSVPLVPPPIEGAVADNSGELSLITPMRVFADLAIAAETGVIRFCRAGRIKDVYLVRGAPESVTSNLNGDRFGEYLVSRGFLRSADLERAMVELPRFGGKLGDALVSLGFMRPLDAFRLLSQHVRERVMELFTWTDGSFGFFRGLRNLTDAFQLGLNSFEILGAGVLSLSYEFLKTHFEPLQDFHPRSMPNPRLSPESFHLGPTPREVLSLLDGSQTLRNWSSRFRSSEEILTFYRTVYLLVESSLAQFE